MKYFLDTNACIALMTGQQNNVRKRFDTEAANHQFCVSTIVLFELQYGIHKSTRSARSVERLRRFLAAGMEIIELTAEDADAAGRIRAELESRKHPIGPFDTLIAGQAIARGLTLITANTREFSRVEGLHWQNWSVVA